MRITVNLDTQSVITLPSPVRVKAGGFVPIEVAFTRGSQTTQLPDDAEVMFILKPQGQLTGGTLVLHTDFSAASGGLYLGIANFNTQPLMSLLGLSDDVTGNDAPQVEAVAELAWTTNGRRFASSSFLVYVEAPLRREEESTPASLPDLKASQTEAEVGTDNSKWMTPLRTAQAIAALAGGGSYVLKQASFHAKSGMRYLVGVSPDGGGAGYGSGDQGSGSGDFSVGSPETRIIITLPANPQPADAIVILDAFDNWTAKTFGQGAIPAVIALNGNLLEGGNPVLGDEWGLEPLPCSCILTYTLPSIGWRIARIETGATLDLGYGTTLDLGARGGGYPDALLLKNEHPSGAGWPRLIAQGTQGRTVSFGMSPYGPLIDVNDTLRIGQFPSPIRVSSFSTLAGLSIQVPIYNTDSVVFGPHGAPQWPMMAVFRGTSGPLNPTHNEPGTFYYDTVTGTVKLLVQNPRPLTITLSGTSHNIFANTFDINGNYHWDAGGFYQHETVNPARIRRESNRWGIYVDGDLYARAALSSSAVYPSKNGFVAQATDDETDFALWWDEMTKRYVTVGGSE